ncbi:hypothetical protein ABH931_003701 [Streptacidiphilus sp. MAP12-33]|uniref:hypothetical protein n=1 Tax=Streptacidiphilus sp. MAP12-33 TaxID=3156266 RepID=UPI0035130A01
MTYVTPHVNRTPQHMVGRPPPAAPAALAAPAASGTAASALSLERMATAAEAGALPGPVPGAPGTARGLLTRHQYALLSTGLRVTPVIGADGRPQVLPMNEIDAALAVFRPQHVEGERAGLANRGRPQLLNALVGPEARTVGYIQGLPPGCLPQVLSAVDLAVEQPVVLRVVYGASTCMPLRALSYVLPAVQLAQRIDTVVGAGRTHVEVVLMGRLGTAVNGLPAAEVSDELGLLARMLTQLLTTLRPGGFSVLGDATADVAEPLTELTRRLGSATRAGTLALLSGRGGSHSDEQTLRYVAAHILLHDLGGVELTREAGSAPPDRPVRIDVGGLLERHFLQARLLMLRELDAPLAAPLVLTRHSVPPYLMARDGDLALRDARSATLTSHPDTPLAKAAGLDLAYLRRHLPPGVLPPNA